MRQRYVAVRGCPCPRQLAPILSLLLKESGAQLESCYRGADAEALLHRLGKSSQADLYEGWLKRLPGYNPANPPGFSTHELRNDGPAYPQWRRGAKLPWWCCGIDIDDGHVVAFIYAAKRHGWEVSRTYPSSASEYHHVNFRRPPTRRAKVFYSLRRLVPLAKGQVLRFKAGRGYYAGKRPKR